MAYAPYLRAAPDMNPVPRVQITFRTMPTAAATATVSRTAAGRTYRVRGGIKITATGGFSLLDYECPFGVTATYSAVVYDTAGNQIAVTDTASTVLYVTGTCIHQPLDPTRKVMSRYLALKGTADTLSREFVGDIVRPQGRSVPVWIGSGRGGLTGVNLPFVTMTAADEAALASIFGDYADTQIPIMCVRTSLPLGLPAPFFGVIRKPVRQGWNQHTGLSTVLWDLTADETAPPAEALLVVILTYKDIENSYRSYSGIEHMYNTYLEAESDDPIAGTA